MKKVFFVAALATLLVSCGSKGNQQPQVLEESASDSLFALNDSTLGEIQTYTYEGILPTSDASQVNYQLALQGINPDSLKSYNLTVSCVGTCKQSPNGNQTYTDQGTVVTLIGIPDDSTAIVYQLVSNGPNHERTNFLAKGDSALTLIGHDFKKAFEDLDCTLHKKL